MFLTSCNQNPNNDIKDSSNSSRNQIKDSVELSKNDQPYQSPISKEKTKEESNKVSNDDFVLDEENAIAFFFEYNKTLKETKVKLETNFGDITIELFDNVPYHKANFIYLTKKGYFNNTYFHR
ncbi:MAG: peptidylprolyl isomerase, partial [Flavobacteriaceae bacterium]|nr:peptidylprolyl isomerase [Flavobacteriaceae bacterium]